MYEKGILLCATKNSGFVIGTQLLNLVFQMPDLDVIYVVHDGFLAKDVQIMKSICKFIDLKFISFEEFDFVKKIHETNKIDVSLSDYDVWSRYTHMTFGRFEALRLLSECKKILYIDFDMILRGSVNELYAIDKPLAMTRASASLEYGLGFKVNGIDCSVSNYGAPIILFTNYLNKPNNLYNEIYNFTAENFLKLSKGKLLDQAVFTAIILKNNLEVEVIDSDIYNGNCAWKKCDQAKILHAFGKYNRFWNNKITALTRPEFFVFYNKWVELGGSKYTDGWQNNSDLPLIGGELYSFLQNYQNAKIVYKALEKYFIISTDFDFSRSVKLQLTTECSRRVIHLEIRNINAASVSLELVSGSNIKLGIVVPRTRLADETLKFINKNYFLV